MYKDIGIGLDYIDFEENLKIKSPVKETIKTVNKLEHFAEEMRILYVALTRAKEKLILIGSLTDTEKSFEKISSAGMCDSDLLFSQTVFSANSYLELILAALYRTKSFDKFQRENKHYVKTNALINIKKLDSPEIPEVLSNDEIKVKSGKSSDDINSILDYSYSYQESNTFLKYTVSELKRLITEPEDSREYFGKLSELDDIENTKITPQKSGSIFHYILEKLNFKETHSIKDLDKLLDSLLKAGNLTKEETSSVDKSAIMDFLSSPLGLQAKESEEIYKERSFNILLDDMFENQTEKIQLQGVIDCYFKYNDEYIILDFKTGLSSEIESYKKQLEFYKKAVKIIHRTENVKAYLYFFKDKKSIEV